MYVNFSLEILIKRILRLQ